MKKFGKTDYGNGVKYWSLFGRPIAKKIDNCFYLLKRQKKDEYEPSAWYVGWKDWMFEIVYHICGYDEPNGELHISMFGWHSIFKFPWKSKRFPDGDCDAPEYGIAIHSNTFWLYKGGDGNLGGGSKYWTWDLPYFTWIHMRHDIECDLGDSEYGEMVRMCPESSLKRYDEEGRYIPLFKNELVKKYNYDYKDSYDGKLVPCIFWVEEREWRRKWFTKSKRFSKVSRYIQIEFSDEVGKEKGSWKGGCMGCSYDLLPNETPMECIKRMERERKF